MIQVKYISAGFPAMHPDAEPFRLSLAGGKAGNTVKLAVFKRMFPVHVKPES